MYMYMKLHYFIPSTTDRWFYMYKGMGYQFSFSGDFPVGYVLKSALSCKLKRLKLHRVIPHCAGVHGYVVHKIVMGLFEVSITVYSISETKKKNFVTLSLCPD